MCLDEKIRKKEFLKKSKVKSKKNSQNILIGWKVVEEAFKKIYPCSFSKVRGGYFKVGKKLNEVDYRRYPKTKMLSISGKDVTYYTGFHVLSSLDEAISYAARFCGGLRCKIIRVWFDSSKRCTWGKQYGLYVAVTKTMFIPKQVPFTRLGKRCKKGL